MSGKKINIKFPLLLIGPHPSTSGLGGVTVHVSRLQDYLDSKEFDYDFCDYRVTPIWTIIKEIAKHQVVHIHVTNPLLRLFLVIVGRLCRTHVIVTLHQDFSRQKGWKRWCVKQAIKWTNVPIALNKKSQEACRELNKKCVQISAFIPPIREEKQDERTLKVLEFAKKNSGQIVSTNASTMDFDKNGNEIYGVHFLVDFFKEKPAFVLLISDPSGKYAAFFDEQDKPLPSNVSFISWPHSFFEVLKHADFCVRNTSTDGDSLTIKEALYLGKCVLCTDVVSRPQNVIMYKYSEHQSFEKALQLAQDWKGKKLQENAAEEIIALYQNILKRL